METTLLGLAARRCAKKVQRQALEAALQTGWSPSVPNLWRESDKTLGFLFVCYFFSLLLLNNCGISHLEPFWRHVERWLPGGERGGLFL